MTKSTITREESVQAVFDLKVGYRLGFADLDILKRVARMALAAMGSSESVELPLDYLQGHKDGLEWAAQLAEANHPETGDWLYDDPIELAKAIRKGPDMPPAQPVADSEPVAYIDKQWTLVYYVPPMCMGLKIGDKLYRHAQQLVDSEPVGYLFHNEYGAVLYSISDDATEGFSLIGPIYSAPQPAPVVPCKWIPVSEQMPPSRHEVLVGRWWGEKPRWCCKWATYIPGHPDAQSSGWLIPGASWTPTHWMPLPAAPQEVNRE